MQKRWYLGVTKTEPSYPIHLADFRWACGWYWSGGYIVSPNLFNHFDECFLKRASTKGHPFDGLGSSIGMPQNEVYIWEPLSFFLDDPQYNERQWWRIKDLFVQFYALRKAAEVFQHGGHCTDAGRSSEEINLVMAKAINNHMSDTIFPLIAKALDHE